MSSARSQFIVLGALLVSVAQVHGEAQVSTGSVKFIVCDTFGDPIRHFRIEVTNRSDSGRHRVLVDKTVATGLEFGTYQVTVTASLFRTLERDIRLQQGESLVILGLTMPHGAQISGTSSSTDDPLSGQAINMPSGPQPVWVRLMSIFGTFLSEAPVDAASGRFRFGTVPNGEYLLLVFQGSKVIATEKITATVDTRSRDVAIEIAKTVM